ncbi:PREDICTED: translocator protein [Nicrophorus vespilloides]|uniref:Translocator protein n=1 Tax=Nicrophorus vespilloides TaxID=110193 RepID=A0ABM1ML50_NICVS|nr:PREDICTED: translocator protein [Nicrophorus vespilloides]
MNVATDRGGGIRTKMLHGCGLATASVLLPSAGGCILASCSCNSKDLTNAWYTGLDKPSWCLQNRKQYAPLAFLANSAVGYASYLVYKHGEGCSGRAKNAMIVYGGHLALRWTWTHLFWGSRNIKLAFYEILAADASILLTAHFFYQIDRKAAILFAVPSALWLGYLTALNYILFKRNAPRIAE